MYLFKAIRKGHNRPTDYGNEIKGTVLVYILKRWAKEGREITCRAGKVYAKDDTCNR